MSNQICPGCQRSVKPLEKLEYDKTIRKHWMISYCPFERCGFNIDLEPMSLKTWNQTKGFFEDYTE